MKKASILFICIVLLILTMTSCSPNAPATTETTSPSAATDSPPETEESNGSDCPGDTISPIGQSIADDFDTVDYQQVMTWFCDGAEFEDILVALETEALTEASVGEMLQMLAEGLTWDEIWQSVGLTD